MAQPDRSDLLRSLTLPALVIHGLHDPLVAPSGGLAAARLLPAATFVGYSGMGHDLPAELWPEFEREIAALAARADAAPASGRAGTKDPVDAAAHKAG
jgi:pimeloyl-ACP methyl ester carboxylesterase